MKIDIINQIIVKKLKELDPEKIILFGSMAKGKANKDSDLDLCIIKKNISSKIKIKRKVRELLQDINIPKDIIVVEPKEFEKYSGENWINTVFYKIKKEGKILYEKRKNKK